MATTILERTPSFDRSVAVINTIDDKKIQLLTNKIIQAADIKAESIFTTSERDKLSAVLDVSVKDVDLIISTIRDIFTQCVYHVCKPGALGQELAGCGLDDGKCAVLTAAWREHGKRLVNSMKYSTNIGKQLCGVHWEVSIGACSSGGGQGGGTNVEETSDVRAVIDLHVDDPTPDHPPPTTTPPTRDTAGGLHAGGDTNKVVTDVGGSREKISMKFTHDQLFTFYNHLETIQKQLDALS